MWLEMWRSRLGGLRLREMAATAQTEAKTRIYSNLEEYEIFEDQAGVIRVRVKRKAERGG